jgi:hypothetical protein
MRASIEAQGVTASVETYEDGAVRIVMLNSTGHALAVATVEAPAAEAPEEEVTTWPRSA